MAGTNGKIIVIGAGIAGVSSAIWLQRNGHDATLVDASGVAAGASYGNAGILATSEVIPVTTPGLLWHAPRLLFHPNEPLFMKWSYLPSMIPFLARYLSHANRESMTRIAGALTPLVHDSVDQHMALARGTAAEQYIRFSDYIYLYDRKADWEAEAEQWQLKRELDLPFEEMGPDDIAREDRNLEGKFGFGIRCTNHGQITDPGAYVTSLARQFEADGGEIIVAKVTDLMREGNQVVGVKTAEGMIDAGQVVIAAGAWSNRLLASLGMKVPMESERGYHIEFVNPNIELASTLMLRKLKFAVNSMVGRMRCGGIVEFGGLDKPPSRGPFELLRRNALATFPDLEYDEVLEWMGHRPSTSDSLPLVGRLEGFSNVWTAFGHQHLGLTAGPKTGRWLAQMMSGEKPNIDMTPYDPNRFGR